MDEIVANLFPSGPVRILVILLVIPITPLVAGFFGASGKWLFEKCKPKLEKELLLPNSRQLRITNVLQYVGHLIALGGLISFALYLDSLPNPSRIIPHLSTLQKFTLCNSYHDEQGRAATCPPIEQRIGPIMQNSGKMLVSLYVDELQDLVHQRLVEERSPTIREERGQTTAKFYTPLTPLGKSVVRYLIQTKDFGLSSATYVTSGTPVVVFAYRSQS